MDATRCRTARLSLKLFLFLLFGCLLLLFFILNIALGSVRIPLGEVCKALLHREANQVHQSVVWEIRFPRALAAVFGGAALATSGLLLQIFFRNPIVDPYVLGVSSGATLVVALLMLTGLALGAGAAPPFLLSAAALAGAAGVVGLVVTVASRVKNVVTLLVIGLMIGYLCSAGSSVLIAFAEKEKVHGFVLWTLGSFSGFCWDETAVLAVGGILLLGGSYFLCKPLNALLLGEDYAQSMGVNIKMLRILIVLFSSGLAALVTAFAGPVAFIGLAGPHLARLALGTSDNKLLIPATALLGGLVATMCDLAARLAFSPVELPVSAVTALFGAPLVISLLLRRRTSL